MNTNAVNYNHYKESRNNHHSMKMLPEVINKRKQQTGVALLQWPHLEM